MILLLSFSSIVIIIIYSYFLTRKKYEFLFYVFSFALILTPSTKILGLYSDSPFNFNINQFIIYLLIVLFPFSITIQLKSKNIYKTINHYYNNFGVFIALIIVSFIVNMGINVMYYKISFFQLPKYHLLEYISFFVIVHFSLILLSKLDPQRLIIIFRNIWITISIYAAILGSLFFFKFHFAEFIQEEAYNFNFKSTNSFLDTAIDASNYLNRSYSIFGGGNQYGILAPLFLIVSFYLLKERIISRKMFSILIIFQLLILTSSLSRTAFLFYLLSWLIIILRSSRNVFKTIFILIGFPIIIYLSISFFNQRIQEIFYIDKLVESFFSERLKYWISFFEILKINPESIYLGLTKFYIASNDIFFENGYLNVWAEGGGVTLCLHFLAYFILVYKLSKTSKNNNNIIFNNFTFDFLFLFFLIELLQGALFSFRFEALVGITISYFIYLKYLTQRVQ